MNNINDIELIDRFFGNAPDDAVIKEFEKRMAADKGFQQLVEEFKLTTEVIKMNARMTNLSRVEGIGKSLSKPFYNRNWFKASVIAVILVATATILFLA